MKFKRNLLLTFNINIFALLLTICPICMIIISFVGEAKNAFFMLPMFLIILFIFTLICNLINIFIWMFSKKVIYVDKKMIAYENTRFKFDEISRLYFEFGIVGKTGFYSPCTLYLHTENDSVMQIAHPSFISVLVAIFKCKNAAKRLCNKGLLITGIALYFIALLTATVAYFS